MASTSSNSSPCLLCGGDARPWLSVPGDWRRPEVRGGFAIVHCDSCRFGSLWPRPTADDIAAFYDVAEYYTHGRRHDDQREDRAFINRLLVRLAWQLDGGVLLEKPWFHERFGTSGGRFCDIGCGAGGLLRIITEAGHEVVGVDPDPAARQWSSDLGFTVLEGTAEVLPSSIANEQFDAVFMTHTLEHCLDPRLAVKNAVSIVKPGGLVVVETPNNVATALNVYEACWLHLDVPRHLNFFTEQSLKLVCEQAGATVENVEYCGYTRQFLGDIIRQQRLIWSRFSAAIAANGSSAPLRAPTRTRAWRLLLRTVLASRARKYDSVRVIATKAKGPR